MQLLVSLVLAGFVLVGTATAAGAHCGVEHAESGAHATLEPIPHATGATDVVFHTETSRNGWGGEYPHAVSVTIYGDGRVVYGDGREKTWSELRLQRFLRDARHIGLLGDATYGEALVTDQGTTTVAIHAAGVDRELSIYALELPQGDNGLPREERQARRALRAFLHEL